MVYLAWAQTTRGAFQHVGVTLGNRPLHLLPEGRQFRRGSKIWTFPSCPLPYLLQPLSLPPPSHFIHFLTAIAVIGDERIRLSHTHSINSKSSERLERNDRFPRFNADLDENGHGALAPRYSSNPLFP